MTYDARTNAVLSRGAGELTEDTGVFLVHTLRTIAKLGDCPASITRDWQTIERWLGCVGRTPSDADDERIGRAWRAYLTVGIAPSKMLQPTFTTCAERIERDAGDCTGDLPPREVISVFERMLASDKDISDKKALDWADQEASVRETEEPTNRRRRTGFSPPKALRIIAAASLAWSAWVLLRTADDYELFGIWPDNWDADMFLINLLLPPFVATSTWGLIRWINAADR